MFETFYFYFLILDNGLQIHSEEVFNKGAIIREAPLHTTDIRRISTSYKKSNENLRKRYADTSGKMWL